MKKLTKMFALSALCVAVAFFAFGCIFGDNDTEYGRVHAVIMSFGEETVSLESYMEMRWRGNRPGGVSWQNVMDRQIPISDGWEYFGEDWESYTGQIVRGGIIGLDEVLLNEHGMPIDGFARTVYDSLISYGDMVMGFVRPGSTDRFVLNERRGGWSVDSDTLQELEDYADNLGTHNIWVPFAVHNPITDNSWHDRAPNDRELANITVWYNVNPHMTGLPYGYFVVMGDTIRQVEITQMTIGLERMYFDVTYNLIEVELDVRSSRATVDISMTRHIRDTRGRLQPGSTIYRITRNMTFAGDAQVMQSRAYRNGALILVDGSVIIDGQNIFGCIIMLFERSIV